MEANRADPFDETVLGYRSLPLQRPNHSQASQLPPPAATLPKSPTTTILPTLKKLDKVFSTLNETVIRIRIPEDAAPSHPLEKRKAGGAPNPLEDNLGLGMLDILAELLGVGQEGLNGIERQLEESELELRQLALGAKQLQMDGRLLRRR